MTGICLVSQAIKRPIEDREIGDLVTGAWDTAVDGYIGKVTPKTLEENMMPMQTEPSLEPTDDGYSRVWLFGVKARQHLTLVFRLSPRKAGIDQAAAVERYNGDKDAFRLE